MRTLALRIAIVVCGAALFAAALIAPPFPPTRREGAQPPRGPRRKPI